MKKKNPFAPFIIFWFVALIISTALKYTTFTEVVNHVNLSEIDSIGIIKSTNKGEERITLTDPGQIENILNTFSRAKLMKGYVPYDSSGSYWIALKAKKERKIGMVLYGTNLDIFSYEDSNNESYKIINVNDVDLTVIKALFK